MVWGDIMTSFWPMCVPTSAIARFVPIFKLEYFWNAKTYTGEILIWCHIDGVLSEKPQNTHNLNCLFFNGCLGWKFKNSWNDCVAFLIWLIIHMRGSTSSLQRIRKVSSLYSMRMTDSFYNIPCYFQCLYSKWPNCTYFCTKLTSRFTRSSKFMILILSGQQYF